MPVHKPSWFSDDHVMVSTAPTCGLGGRGRIRYVIDRSTGRRVKAVDPETGVLVPQVDDRLLLDAEALLNRKGSDTLRFVPSDDVSLRHAVPVYFDRTYDAAFDAYIESLPGFESRSLGELAKVKAITVRAGHGSPSSQERVGKVPYIKVSDLRAGLVNINPTNRVPLKVAERFWKGPTSGLRPYDIMCPSRTSKNIGDFCVLMPGQEQVVLTKEILILRPGSSACFDPFYLLWAMSLKVVRDQWKRIVFMQTNREDVGKRYLEVRIPVPPNREAADRVSKPFRDYFPALAKARTELAAYLHESEAHHFFVAGAVEEDEAEDEPSDDREEEEATHVDDEGEG